ncbi:hypothetical protein FACS189437_05980 [Bacteroidia bacterium]|nr:hypothetical protein FACS189437_05980 [Bacteroidia bacterium]
MSDGQNYIRELTVILADGQYMASEQIYTDESCSSGYEGGLPCELSVLTKILPFLELTLGETEVLKNFLISKLTVPYNKNNKDYNLYQNYSLITSALASNSSSGRYITDALLDVITAKTAALPKKQVWSARALANTPYLTLYQQRKIIKTLEPLLAKYSDILKEMNDDPNLALHILPNQYLAKKIFIAKNSFFAKKGTNITLTTFIESATFAGPQRALYFQNDYPGMDGDSFASTWQGHMHNISANLISALFKAYALSGEPENMNYFIIRYGRLNSNKTDFENYLMFAKYAMDEAFIYNDDKTIAGWTEQYKIFSKQITRNINKVSPDIRVWATVQGGPEVAADWTFITMIFGAGATAVKYAGKLFPPIIKSALKYGGIPTAAGLFILTKDASSHAYYEQVETHNIVMPEEEVKKLMDGGH